MADISGIAKKFGSGGGGKPAELGPSDPAYPECISITAQGPEADGADQRRRVVVVEGEQSPQSPPWARSDGDLLPGLTLAPDALPPTNTGGTQLTGSRSPLRFSPRGEAMEIVNGRQGRTPQDLYGPRGRKGRADKVQQSIRRYRRQNR